MHFKELLGKTERYTEGTTKGYYDSLERANKKNSSLKRPRQNRLRLVQPKDNYLCKVQWSAKMRKNRVNCVKCYITVINT